MTRKIEISDKVFGNVSVREWQASQGVRLDGNEFYQVNDTVYLSTGDANSPMFGKAYRCLIDHNSSATFEADFILDRWEEIFTGPNVYHPKVDIALTTNESIAAFAAPLDVKDGVTLVSGTSRILLLNQTDLSENGIWIYNGDASALTRPLDYNSNFDCNVGDFVVIDDGTYGNTVARIIDTNHADNNTVEVDTNETTWLYTEPSIPEIAPVDVALVANENISPLFTFFGMLDGHVMTVGDRILLTGQTDPTENGIWVFEGDGVNPTRPTDYGTANNRAIGIEVIVKHGNTYANTEFQLIDTSNADDETVVIDTDQTTWQRLHYDRDHLRPAVEMVFTENVDITNFNGAAVQNGENISNGERVLLTGQTNPVENGIRVFEFASGDLLRTAPDFSTTNNERLGVHVAVKRGDHPGTFWIIDSSNNADQETVVIDTDEHTWNRLGAPEDILPVNIALDSNESIAAFSAPGNVKDGVTLVAGTSRILLTGQTDPIENGIYIYQGDAAAMTRPTDYSTIANVEIGAEVMVKQGTFEDTQWRLNTSNSADEELVTVDTNETTWINEDTTQQAHFKTTDEDDYTPGRYVRSWIGTRAEYDSITSPDENTLYYLTDEDTAIGAITRLEDLENVNLDSPDNGDVLTYNSVTGSFEAQESSGASTLTELTDVNISSPSNGDVLVYNSGNSRFENQDSLQDSGWQSLSYSNSWVDFASGWEARYKKIGKTVFLKGLVKSGSTASGVLVATLPAGFRPSSNTMYSTPTANGNICEMRILSNGQIRFQRNAQSSWTSIACSFNID